MKNSRSTILFLALLIIVVEATNVSAQVRAVVGIRMGINIANASYTSAMSRDSKSPRTGLLLGGIVEIGISDILCLRAEPMYVQNGAVSEISVSGQTIKETYKLAYLEIPIHLKAQFGSGPVRPYVFAGPNMGLLLSAYVEEEISPPLLEGELRQSGTRDIKAQLSSTNFAVDLGGGAAYYLTTNISLLVDVRYSHGLSDIAKPTDPYNQGYQLQSWKSRDIKVLAGVLIVV